MTNHPLGQACALLTAIVWGYALVLFKLSGEHIPPLALNLFKSAVGLTLLVLTIIGLTIWDPASLAPVRAQPVGGLCLLLLSGAIGIALADTLFFRA
ncbi:MAG TPA: EamA family transporter, partial [Phycisphaerae bacterium]|nr:EamA family transporter [Phycisphaerae bacterium]